MTLSEIKPNQECMVVDVHAEDILGQRLLDMGFVTGARIKVIRNAPLVDPVEVSIRGYFLSLRHSEARLVEVVLL